MLRLYVYCLSCLESCGKLLEERDITLEENKRLYVECPVVMCVCVCVLVNNRVNWAERRVLACLFLVHACL